MNHPSISEQITFIYTDDLEKSSNFYEEKLCLALVLDQGGCRIYRITGTAYLGVCLRPAGSLQKPDPQKRGVIFTLVTPEVDAWYEFLTQKGIDYETTPQWNDEYGIYHSFLRDPNGYLIEIQRFKTEDWAQA
jgi:catechol 2,3-dioxygenase-like lactoylglutathione lyase family enzyme